jgi:hypothetical protein
MTAYQEGQQDSWKEEDFSVTHATFSSVLGRHSTLCNQIVLPDSTGVVFHYSIFLVQPLEQMLRKGKELSQIPMLRTTSPIGVTTSKLNQSLTWSEMTLSCITEPNGYMKARVRSWWHGSKVDWHHIGYLLKINGSQALIGQMVDICETAMIWLDDRCEPRGTLSWEWTMCKHYLGWSSRELNKQGMLSIITPWRSTKHRIRTWLVVATQLQAQQSSFRLCTSSNMPSVPMNVTHESFC